MNQETGRIRGSHGHFTGSLRWSRGGPGGAGEVLHKPLTATSLLDRWTTLDFGGLFFLASINIVERL